jgi:hypothetical protein
MLLGSFTSDCLEPGTSPKAWSRLYRTLSDDDSFFDESFGFLRALSVVGSSLLQMAMTRGAFLT